MATTGSQYRPDDAGQTVAPLRSYAVRARFQSRPYAPLLPVEAIVVSALRRSDPVGEEIEPAEKGH